MCNQKRGVDLKPLIGHSSTLDMYIIVKTPNFMLEIFCIYMTWFDEVIKKWDTELIVQLWIWTLKYKDIAGTSYFLS